MRQKRRKVGVEGFGGRWSSAKGRLRWIVEGFRGGWKAGWSIAKAPQERCHTGEGLRKSEQAESKGKAMPAAEGLGTSSPPLSVWLRAAAPEEIKKCPGVLAVMSDRDQLGCGAEKTREKVLSKRLKLYF